MASNRTLPADVYPETLSRLRPVRREQLDEAQQKLYDALIQPPSGRLNLAGIKGPGGIELRMPKLLAHRGDINRKLRVEIGLDDALVELAILAAAREIDSQFVWAMHEPVAREAGVPDATIERIRHRQALDGLPEKQAALIALARESIGERKVGAATYARAATVFGEEDLLHYSLLMASYVQHAILLSVVGQELHDHQRPGLPVL
ncbi:MAG: carboxymuconolactone decarboxylase [Panacagrimonas sp.]|jgi:4-carboxymuconolactone decarboxylase|nr:carboxymuconolactone decarboxylase family protein [Panacagrimonas sp.]MCC2656097.1 carboxymuconolactone decarboxylase [Panacagrimonas sp.]